MRTLPMDTLFASFAVVVVLVMLALAVSLVFLVERVRVNEREIRKLGERRHD